MTTDPSTPVRYSLESLRKTFEQDRFATENNIEIIDAAENYAKVQMTVTTRHRNARGAIMGGAIYTMADFAFAVAANPGHPDTVTLESSITFLNSGKSDILYAEAHCEKDGKRVCCYNITVTDDQGALIALVRTTGMRVGTRPFPVTEAGEQE